MRNYEWDIPEWRLSTIAESSISIENISIFTHTLDSSLHHAKHFINDSFPILNNQILISIPNEGIAVVLYLWKFRCGLRLLN